MKSTKSRADAMARAGGGGVIPSRWNDSRRSVESSRCATTSRTIHAPATVGLAHDSSGNPRRSVTRLPETGRKSGRVSIAEGGSSGMEDSLSEKTRGPGTGDNRRGSVPNRTDPRLPHAHHGRQRAYGFLRVLRRLRADPAAVVAPPRGGPVLSGSHRRGAGAATIDPAGGGSRAPA